MTASIIETISSSFIQPSSKCNKLFREVIGYNIQHKKIVFIYVESVSFSFLLPGIAKVFLFLGFAPGSANHTVQFQDTFRHAEIYTNRWVTNEMEKKNWYFAL